jgi:hypothetical protein
VTEVFLLYVGLVRGILSGNPEGFMRHFSRLAVAILFCANMAASSFAEDQNRPPMIKHEPVTVAVRGQPITILANITDDSGLVKSATLFYSASKDAAPFRSPMKSSGTSLYYGTIPAGVISSVDSISYYIEALDHVDAAQETPWHTIAIKDATAPAKTIEPAAADVSASQAPAGKSGGPSALTVGAIAVGAAAVVGGAVLLANSGGDSSGDGGGGSGTEAGTFVGSVTECSSLNGASSSCNSHSILINISNTGVVTSDSLREGVSLEGPLRGSEFALVAQLTGVSTGEVVYSGTVVDQRIFGSITGSSESSAGKSIYSGTFTATKN